MTSDRRGLLGATAALGAAAILHRRAHAQGQTIKIGVLNDQSGPYRDIGGLLSVNAARMAVQEFGGDMKVEVLSADHQNKPDVGVSIARQWIDRDGVDLIVHTDLDADGLADRVFRIGPDGAVRAEWTGVLGRLFGPDP